MSDHRERHIVAVDAMRFLDGEMMPADQARVQRHVDACLE
jgi:hypothetical protein